MAEHGHTEGQPGPEAGDVAKDLAATEAYAQQFRDAQVELEAEIDAAAAEASGVGGFLKRLTPQGRRQQKLGPHYKQYSLGIMQEARSGAEADAAFLREHIEVAATAAHRVAELQRQAVPGPGESVEAARDRIAHEYQSGREAAAQAAVTQAGDEDPAPVRTAQAAQTAYDRSFLERTA